MESVRLKNKEVFKKGDLVEYKDESSDSYIVLVTGIKDGYHFKGVVVNTNYKELQLGELCKTFLTNSFTKYIGKLELSN